MKKKKIIILDIKYLIMQIFKFFVLIDSISDLREILSYYIFYLILYYYKMKIYCQYLLLFLIV